ncbi:MAG: hypothetical protein GY827_01325 [Cytophagales bacterium]|nr:hypothetical protein [Cytophagales bacterium]
MKKILLGVCTLLVSLVSYAQVDYELCFTEYIEDDALFIDVAAKVPVNHTEFARIDVSFFLDGDVDVTQAEISEQGELSNQYDPDYRAVRITEFEGENGESLLGMRVSMNQLRIEGYENFGDLPDLDVYDGSESIASVDTSKSNRLESNNRIAHPRVTTSDTIFLGTIRVPLLPSPELVEVGFDQIDAIFRVHPTPFPVRLQNIDNITDLSPSSDFVVSIPLNDPTFTGLASEYCTSSYLAPIEVASEEGTFEGVGMNQADDDSWYFDPEEAGPGTHTITRIALSGDEYSLTTTVNEAPCASTVVNDETSAFIADPIGIVTDCDGQIYTSSSALNVITLIDTFGVATIIAGDTTKPAGFADGPALTAQIRRPFGMVLTSAGDLYFVDGQNHAVRRLSGGVVTTIAGGGNKTGTLNGDSDIPADKALNLVFDNPSGLAINDTEDTLYVADAYNQKIKGISLISGDVFFVAGGGTVFPTQGNPTSPTDLRLTTQGLSDIVYSQGQIFMTDKDAHTIYVYDLEDDLVYHVSGSLGNTGTDLGDASTTARFSAPYGIAADGDGNLYVVDQGNATLKKFTKQDNGDFEVTVLAGSNLSFEKGCVDGVGADARFTEPTYISVYVNGFIDVTDIGCDEIKRIAIDDYLNNPLDAFEGSYCISSTQTDTINPTTVSGYYTNNGNLLDSAGGYWLFSPNTLGNYEICYHHELGPCSGEICDEINVYENPVVNFVSGTTFCTANFGIDSIEVDDTYANYQWGYTDDLSNTFVYGAADTLSKSSVRDRGFYTVEIETENGCVASDTVEISTYPDLEIDYSLSDTRDSLCFGENRTIRIEKVTGTGTGALVSFEWNTGETTQNITADANQEYVMRAYDTEGCWDTVSYDNLIKPLLDVCIEVDDSYTNENNTKYGDLDALTSTINKTIEVCSTEDVLVDGTCSNADSYTWTFPNGSTVSTSSITAVDSGRYVLSIVKNGCTNLDTIFINYYDEPLLDIGTTEEYIICKGDSILLSFEGNVADFSNFTWNDVTANVQIKDGATETTAYAKEAGFVELIGIDANNCPIRDTARIIVDAITVDLTAVKDSVCYGEQVNLIATPQFALGNYDFTWEYQVNNATKKDLGTTSSSIPNITTDVDSLGAVNKFFVTIEDDNNCTFTDSLIIFQNDSVQANVIDSLIYICGDETVVNLIDAEVNNGVAPYQYLWTTSNNVAVKLANEDSLQVGVLSQTPVPTNVTLTFEVTDALGCVAEDTAALRLELFRYRINKQYDSVCTGLRDSLEAEILNGGSGDYTYLWFGQELSSTSGRQVYVEPTTTGYYVYNLSIFDNQRQCQATAVTDSFLVREVEAVIDFGADTLVSCEEGLYISTSINSNGVIPYKVGNPYLFTWEILDGPGNIQAGTEDDQEAFLEGGVFGEYSEISLNLIDSLGCKGGSTALVYWNPPLVYNGLDTSYICTGSRPVTVNPNITGGSGNVTYDWNILSGQVSISDTSSATPSFSFDENVRIDTSLVQLVAIDSAGCDVVDTLVIISSPLEGAIEVLSSATCPNERIDLTVNVDIGESAFLTYLWQATNGAFANQTAKTSFGIPLESVQYSVVVTDTVSGCSFSDVEAIPFNKLFPIIVRRDNGNVDVISSLDIVVVCSENELTLDASLSRGGDPFNVGEAYQYQWEFKGSGSFSNSADEQVTINGGTIGEYTTVALTITDEATCNEIDSITVYWNRPVKPYLADTNYVCTPNGGFLAVDSIDALDPVSSYLWEKIGTSNDALIESPLTAISAISRVNDNDLFEVVLTVEDSASCVGYDTTVVAGINFQIDASAQFDTICPNVDNELTVTVTNDGNGDYSYNWTPGGDTTAIITVTPSSTTTYTVEVTDEKTACIATTDVTVRTIDFVSTINNLSDTLIRCADDESPLTFEVNSTGGTLDYTYSWTTDNPAMQIEDSLPTVVNILNTGIARPSTTTLFVDVTDQANCVSKDSVKVYWHSDFEPQLLDSIYVCTPNPTLVEIDSIINPLSTSYTYVWSRVDTTITLDGDTGADTIFVNTTAGNSTQLVLAVTDSLGCVNYDTTTVIGLDFQVNITADYLNICENIENTLSVSLEDGRGTYGYTWEPSITINRTDAQTVVVNPEETTTYIVEVVDSITSCVARDSVTINIIPMVIQAGNGIGADTLSSCDTLFTVNSTVVSGGAGGYQYTWSSTSVGQTLTNTDQSSVLLIATESDLARPAYTQVNLVIEDAIGCIATDSARIEWNPLVNVAINEQEYLCKDENRTVSLVSNGGTGTITYDWNVVNGDAIIAGDTSSNTLMLTGGTAGLSSTIEVVITDEKQCQATDRIQLVSHELTPTSLTLTYDTVCVGSEIVAEASAQSSIAGTTILYSWDNGATFETDTIYQNTIQQDTTIQVIIRDSISTCQITLSDDVIAQDITATITPANSIICFEDTARLCVDAVGGATINKYTWQIDGVNTTDTTKCVELDIQPTGLTTGRLINVIVEDVTGCQDSVSLELFKNHEILADAGIDDTLCVNETLTLLGGDPTGIKNGVSTDLTTTWSITSGEDGVITSNEGNFEFSTSGTLDNEYKVELKITDDNAPQCYAIDEKIIYTKSIPVVGVIDTFTCGLDSIVLKAQNTPHADGTNFTWTLPSGLEITQDSLETSEEGTYKVVAIDTFGCRAIDGESFIVDRWREPSVTIDTVLGLCNNGTISLDAILVSDDTTNTLFTWEVLTGTGTLVDTNSIKSSYLSLKDETELIVRAIYESSCPTVVDTFTTEVSRGPVLEVNVSLAEANIEDPIEYTVTGDKDNLVYTWELEGAVDEDATGAFVQTSYEEEGVYEAKVTAYDPSIECSARDSIEITINKLNQLYIPNVFSPAAQNEENQVWKIYGKNFSPEEFSVEVYNRWGELVFYTEDLTLMRGTGWTGVHYEKDTDQPAGAYTYIIKGNYKEDGQTFEKVGTVTIVR